MGKRGPAPKPTALRLLHGARKSFINTDEPPTPEGPMECPPEASDEVRAIWDYTVLMLEIMGTASPAGRDSLLVYCEAVVTHRKASALMARSEVLIRGMHGTPVRNPLVQIQRDAAAVIRAFAQEFGLTPSARSQIRSGLAGMKPRDDSEGRNPFAASG